MMRYLLLVVSCCWALSAQATFQDHLESPEFSLFRLAVLSTYSSDEMPEVTATVFPTDEAFDSLPEGLVGWFFAHPDKLKALVDYHLINEDAVIVAPQDLIWKTVTTLEGSTMQGLMVEGKVSLVGNGHDLTTGRNVADVDPEKSNNGFFVTNSVLFPDSLVPCDGDQDCSVGRNCRWYSKPECPDNTDIQHGPAAMMKLYTTCTGLATCQSCSMAMGMTCEYDAQCCGDAQCGDQGCCAPIGTTCSTPGSDSTCCTGTCGDANTCCIADGEPCGITDECCEGVCVIGSNKNHRICRTPPPPVPCTGLARDAACSIRHPDDAWAVISGFCTGPAGSNPSGSTPETCRISGADCASGDGAWNDVDCFDVGQGPADQGTEQCLGVGDCD